MCIPLIAVLGLFVLVSLLMFFLPFPCRPSLAEQAERGHPAPVSPPPTQPFHPHLQATAELPSPTPLQSHIPITLTTPPASPCPPPATNQCDDRFPASAPRRVPFRYEHVTLPEPVFFFISVVNLHLHLTVDLSSSDTSLFSLC